MQICPQCKILISFHLHLIANNAIRFCHIFLDAGRASAHPLQFPVDEADDDSISKDESFTKKTSESLGGSDFFLYLCPRLSEFKYIYNMQVNTLNQSQMMILESFAGARDEQEVNDLMDMLRGFYAQRLEKEMQRLWDDGTLDDNKLEQLRGEHLRTPFRL